MCGIFGIVQSARATIAPKTTRDAIGRLFVLSESRGREAAGLAVVHASGLDLLKSAVPASRMVRSREYRVFADAALPPPIGSVQAVLGHSRLVTTGTHLDPANNQPINHAGAVGVHNGIVVNHEAIWAAHPALTRSSRVDTEALIALIRLHSSRGQALSRAVQMAYAEIQGAASIAVAFDDLDALLLATNTGSLYCAGGADSGVFVFASESYILRRLLARHGPPIGLSPDRVAHIEAGQARLVRFDSADVHPFPLALSEAPPPAPPPVARVRRPLRTWPAIEPPRIPMTAAQRSVGLADTAPEQTRRRVAALETRFPHDPSFADSLRRCSRCILPETMPFISFDETGVCNFCRAYRPLEFAGLDLLRELVAAAPRQPGSPDCVVGVSGGRDSLFCLHHVVRTLGLSAVAYTYDWGMVTDLARRNISRICAKLGVEHILVSADIARKRRYIRDNVAAWLHRPRLGMIPLFMAGDKHYFVHLQRVRRQTGAAHAILGENMLERTDFKTGYAGVPPYRADPRHVYTMPAWSNLRLAAYYARECLLNPAYLNGSMLDSLGGFAAFYLIRRRYLNLYNFVPWIEDEVVPTLRHQYDFELAPDSPTTWRIGDGTAAFYNYVYFTVAGFTENDTFRSNQIREGHLSRETALARVREENRPRFETILWYLDTIGLPTPPERVLGIVHAMPKRRSAPR
jgi:glucosamine--fructose-6-phosphate aminotransferase (isomerizing)